MDVGYGCCCFLLVACCFVLGRANEFVCGRPMTLAVVVS